MPDVYAVLKEKEVVIARVRREIEVLRAACELLTDESDFRSNTGAPGVEEEERDSKFSLSDEKKASLARIRARLADAPTQRTDPTTGTSFLLPFKQVAQSARRFLNNRSSERDPQRRTMRHIFGLLGRSNAA